MKKVLLFFAIMMMAITASARDVVFTGNDTWSKNYSTQTITCTKDGVTLSLSGDAMTPDLYRGEIVFEGSTATITVDAGTATVTGVSVTGEPDFNNFDLTGAGPWTCPVYLNGLKPDDASSGLDFVQGFTVHINTLNSAGYATFSCKDNVNISGAEAYKASVDGETITLAKLTGYIPAGTGVILYSEDPSATFTLSVPTSSDAAADVSNNDLKATTQADGSLVATVDANSWALGEGQEFLHFTGSAYIPKRAYLVHEKRAGAKAMRMVFAEGETTGIDATMIETATREGKFIDGSKIVIIKNGTKYNVAGQVIK